VPTSVSITEPGYRRPEAYFGRTIGTQRLVGRRDRAFVIGAFALVIGLTAFLSWRLPYAGDEASHLFMVRHHAHHLDLVSWDEMQYGGERGHPYFFFSPLPYAVYVPFALLDEHVGDLPGAVRPDRELTRLGGGIVLAAAQLALTLALVRRMIRAADQTTVTAIALAANLLPQLLYIHASPNTDGVTILAGTACFWGALRVLQSERVGLRDAALVGVLVGVTMHVRFQAFLAAAVLLAAFAVRALQQAVSLRPKLRMLGVAVAIPVLLAGSFHLVIYDELDNGHLLPTVDNEQLNDSTYTGELVAKPATKPLISRRIHQIPDVWMGAWAWYVGLVELHGIWLLLLAVLCATGLAGLLLPKALALDGHGRVIGLAAVGATAAVWIAMAAQWFVGQQGKFLLPVGFTALVAFVIGSGEVLGRVTRLGRPLLVGAAAWGTSMVVLDLWALSRVAAA
jgi:hypothetical protein